MGAVCTICGKDMMKAKDCGIAKVHVCGKVRPHQGWCSWGL